MKTLLVLFGALLLTGVLIFSLVTLKNKNYGIANMSLALMSDDNAWGEGGLTLIEYSDFQCPACAAYWPLLKQLKTEFGDDLTFVYRHFPLRNIHSSANIAAQAAEAAGLQGKFWDMSDKIFEGQSIWNKSPNPEEIFKKYAQELKLDLDKFETDLNSEAIKGKINKHLREAKDLNLPGTPSFFLNGKYINNPNSYEGFKKLIENELAK